MWGLAIAAVTALLYKYRNRSQQFLFWMGTFLGGAYEYICSVFTEIVFGTVFWDYSDIPFNLGGRINLLYCFFWGFAAVAWFKIILSACFQADREDSGENWKNHYLAPYYIYAC